MTFPSFDEYREAQARRAMEARLESATAIALELLRTYRDDRPRDAAYVVQRLADTQDLQLLMLVFGDLLTRLIAAERRANDAHGPLVTAAEQEGREIDARDLGTWAVGVQDQMAAAVAARDYHSAATVAVDGALLAYKHDDGGADLDYVLRSCLQLNHQNVALMAAEAMRRLYVQRYGDA